MAKAKSFIWQSKIVGHEKVRADQLLANPQNHRRHPQRQREVVAASIDELGFLKSVIVNRRTGHIVDGHERVMQALGVGDGTLVDVEYVDLSPEDESKALLVLDASSELAGTDEDRLRGLVEECQFSIEVLNELAKSMIVDCGFDGGPETQNGSLAERFGVVPFSVLNGLDDWWRLRRDDWISKGSTSQIDPVLCELFFRWFVPTAGIVTGGCRVVAAACGLRWVEALSDDVELDFAIVESFDELLVCKTKPNRFVACVPADKFASMPNDFGSLRYYNEAVILRDSADSVGFLADCHDMIFIFLNGDAKLSVECLGSLVVSDNEGN